MYEEYKVNRDIRHYIFIYQLWLGI